MGSLNENYSKADIDVHERLTRIETKVDGINDIKHMLSDYCEHNTREHKDIWEEVKNNSKIIHRVLGGFFVVGALLGAIGLWVKEKIGG